MAIRKGKTASRIDNQSNNLMDRLLQRAGITYDERDPQGRDNAINELINRDTHDGNLMWRVQVATNRYTKNIKNYVNKQRRKEGKNEGFGFDDYRKTYSRRVYMTGNNG